MSSLIDHVAESNSKAATSAAHDASDHDDPDEATYFLEWDRPRDSSPDFEDRASDFWQTEDDRADLFDEAAARRYLQRPLPLAELIDFQAGFFRRWGNNVGRLIAGRLDDLAGEIRATCATDPETFMARDELLVKWNGENA